VQVSPHVLVAANSPYLAELEADWAWAVKHYGKPKNTEQEFSDWSHACAVGPYRCTGSFGSAIGSGFTPNFKTEELWNDGLDMLVEDTGDVVPVVDEDLAAKLENLVREALKKFDSGELKFSQAQEAAIARNGKLYNTYKGDLIDSYVKNALINSGDDEEYNLYITARYKFGPDVTRLSGLPDYVEWYDITTRGQWAAHFRKYVKIWGPDGKGVFWNEIESAMSGDPTGDTGEGVAPGGE